MVEYNVTRNGITCVYTDVKTMAAQEQLEYERVRDRVSLARKNNIKQYLIRGQGALVFVEVVEVKHEKDL